MEAANPLAALKDIHLPEPPGIWPLAPGWYISLIVVLIGLGLIIHVLKKRYRLNQPKKEALRLLHQVREDFKKDPNSQIACATIGELLKRVALSYYPRKEVASLHGQEWIAFLNKTGKKIDFNPEASLLLEVPFQPPQTLDITPLFHKAEKWIQQRRPHV